MNNSNPNPLVPQGSVLEQQSKSRSRVRIALFVVVALHVVFLGPLLIQGCKPESGSSNSQTNASYLAPLSASNLVENMNTPADPITSPGAVSTPADLTFGTGGLSTSNETPHATLPIVPDRTEPAPITATHKIVQGDTLDALARKYHVPLRDLLAANPNANPTRLRINETIVIPAPTSMMPVGAPESFVPGESDGTTSYKVKAGDNLINIARAHGTTVKAIQSANGLRTTGIRAGQTLKIPAKAPAGSASTGTAAMPPTASLAPTTTSSIR